jgi:hypothetical protein
MQVLAVRPSRCGVAKVYVTRNLAVLATDRVTAMPEVDLVPGHAYYVGDQFGSAA